MAPKKRTASRASNSEPPSKSQRGNETERRDDGAAHAATGASSDAHQKEHESDHAEGHEHDDEQPSDDDKDLPPPEQYICIDRPQWDEENEKRAGVSASESEDAGEPPEKPDMWKKPAAEHPDWKWVASWQTWTILCDFMIRRDYCNPDMFDMYIYNDFYGYGLQEMLENLLIDINKELSKKTPDLQQMWAPMAALLHWKLCMRYAWMDHDDGERTQETADLIGYAMLSCLNELDHAGVLRPDSDFRDIGLVMMMFLEYERREEGMSHKPGVREVDNDDDDGWHIEDVGFERLVLAYAKKAGIDLGSAPLYNRKELLEPLGKVEPLEDEAKPDRWGWSEKFKKFKGVSMIGGHYYDITKWTRKERAAQNFDKKDPLADVSAKDLKEGNIMFK